MGSGSGGGGGGGGSSRGILERPSARALAAAVAIQRSASIIGKRWLHTGCMAGEAPGLRRSSSEAGHARRKLTVS